MTDSPIPSADGSTIRTRSPRLRGLRRPGSPAAAIPALPPEVTIVVPTRNEAGNVDELLRRLDLALGSLRAEVLFVDDSDDETPAVIRSAAARYSRNIRLLHREPGRRDGRLGGAVIAGFQLAAAPWAVVIDGDLQHPPEVIPSLVAAGRQRGVDLVYGSRYVESGDAGGLSGSTRHWVSKLSTWLTRIVFPRKLRSVSDPMSGFFAVRVAALDLPALRPAGYKVLLEILAQSKLHRSVAVPFSFQPRYSGESKASLAEGLRFLSQLLALRLGMTVGRLGHLAAFLVVGATGVGVNTAILWLFSAAWWHVPYLIASALATNVSIVTNFILLKSFVFRGRKERSSWSGLARFWLVNVALLPVQLGLLALLVEGLALQPVTANVLVLGMVFALRFVLTSTWVFGARGAPADAKTTLVRLNASSDDKGMPTAAYPFEQAGPVKSWRRHLGPLRLLLPIATTLMAVPAAAVQSWRLLEHGGLAAAELVAVLAAGTVVAASRFSPSQGEPDVHDRQLDVIMAGPLLAVAVWLSWGWPAELAPTAPWQNRDVLTVCLFLTGSTLLLLGTRLTVRLRWVLCLPVIALPAVTGRQLLLELIVFAVVGASLAVAILAARGRRRMLHGYPALPHRHQQLPSWRLAGAVVVGVAAFLLFLSVTHAPVPENAATPVSVPAPGSP